MINPAGRPTDFSVPYVFPSGLVLSAIELECRQCSLRFKLSRGYGISGESRRGSALVAQASCPHCEKVARFVILLSPTGEARIQRISGFTQWLLATVLGQGRPVAQHLPASLGAAPVRCTLGSPIIGRYRDRDIPEYIQVEGRRYDFERVLPNGIIDPEGLHSDEYAIRPGLVYRLAS